MEAFKNPSGEHLTIYVGVGLALAIVAAIVVMATGGKKKDSLKLTLDEMPEEKPKRARVKRPDGAAQPAKDKKKAKKEEEDWEDEPFDREALLKDLDATGPYEKSLDGTVSPEDMVRLRKVIGKYSYMAF